MTGARQGELILQPLSGFNLIITFTASGPGSSSLAAKRKVIVGWCWWGPVGPLAVVWGHLNPSLCLFFSDSGIP